MSTVSKPEVQADQERLVRVSAYDAFQAREGIPIIHGFAVQDLRQVEVEPWARLECFGTYINVKSISFNRIQDIQAPCIHTELGNIIPRDKRKAVETKLHFLQPRF